MEQNELDELKIRVDQIKISNYSKKLINEVIKKAERYQAKVQQSVAIKHSFVMTLWIAFQKLQEDKAISKDDKVAIRSLMYEFAGRTLLMQYEAGWLAKTKISPKHFEGFMKIEC